MINLTAAAVARVKIALEKEQDRLPTGGLRVFLQGSCSGLLPGLALDQSESGDVVFEQEGIKLIVDPRSLDLLQDAVIDYRNDAHGEGFSIETPHPLPACACGHPCDKSTVDEILNLCSLLN